MNWMPWAAAQQPKETIKPETPRGMITGVPLGDVRRLCLAHTVGAFGRVRPPLDHTAMALSLDLAYMTYTLDLEPWMHAGWMDISIQVDNHLQSGVTVSESESAGSERMRGLMNSWRVGRARMAMKGFNPVAQLMGAYRQREKSDTIKAVTMLHEAADGRFVVAIGFMGTGPRFYDWFSNFRFTTEDGFHKGFNQLTEYFLQSAEHIYFPEAAARLKLPVLRLSDILAEMKTPNSRFALWMAGHSQGAAIMQVFCHRLLTRYGVLARHMVGYGFASPTTAATQLKRDEADYPLYHIINTDDLVPRVGALTHLGIGLRYDADDALRSAAYGWDDTPESVQLRTRAESLFEPVQDTPSLLVTLAALSQTILEEKTDDSLNALMEKRWSIAPIDKVITYAGEKAKDSLVRLSRYTRVAYFGLVGSRMDEQAVLDLQQTIRPTVVELPLRKLLSALGERYHAPHMLFRERKLPGAYAYIVLEGFSALEPFIWQGGMPPVRIVDTAPLLFTPRLPGNPRPAVRRRMPPHIPAIPSARWYGVGLHSMWAQRHTMPELRSQLAERNTRARRIPPAARQRARRWRTKLR